MSNRKRGWWTLGGALAVAGAVLLPATAGPQVIVDGETVQGIRVYTIGGRTMVPVRGVIERIPGAGVQFVRAGREIIVTDRGQRVVLHRGSRIAQVGGRNVSLDAPVVMRNGKALMPARFAEDVLGAKVDYDRTTQIVRITARGRGASPVARVHPVHPAHPVHPVQAANPVHPAHPAQPAHSAKPAKPVHPAHPVHPVK